ncbi:unnamed protein product [Chrysodeixis includens]|uniref:Uncharacterized protein n=1 Tax=Chrysodeixis includens TaxID=689277 RepID=A0A9N8L8B8_CHRIL|nr:unnamed protein product [Chrysodeixis includens]
MDKRKGATDKKTDNKTDRGDTKKTHEKFSKKIADDNIHTCKENKDRGDSERRTNHRPERIKPSIVAKKAVNDDIKYKYASDYIFKDHGRKVYENTDSAPVEVELPERQKKQSTEETTQTKDKTRSTTPSGKTESKDKKLDKNPPQKTASKRKPMIKTIMSKNGSVRIYKAVTFVDQKRSPPTPLEINIPCDSIKKNKVSKFTDTSSLKVKTKPTVSRESTKAAVVRKKDRRRDRRSRHVPSPDLSTGDMRSPPTEVARWAPACIDRHTKPYYEAWVNTTLAAISKCSKKDKLYFEKQRKSILQSFHRAILEDRPQTPELFYANFADEKYTGRIKITQR